MKCPKCNNTLYLEEEINNYPLWCEECDENFFIFEGIEEYENEKKEFYNYIGDLE